MADAGNSKPVEQFSNHKPQLPQIRAGAWLDPKGYCRGGGKSIAGTEAARKLLRGKKDLIELLGYAVHETAKESIVCTGHGIPPQVLQHHVDFAAQLLVRLQAQNLSFKQFNDYFKHNSVAAIDAVQNIRQVLVRDAVTGENRAIPWPLMEEPKQWVEDLTLYWTVMNRIATRLGVAVLMKRPGIGHTGPLGHAEPQYQFSPSTTSTLNTPPHYWKVEFQRDWHFAPEQLPGGASRSHPQQQQQLYPVLEFTPLKGVAAPGHCRIRLQGLASNAPNDKSSNNNSSPMRVSLSFDACFRINHGAAMMH